MTGRMMDFIPMASKWQRRALVAATAAMSSTLAYAFFCPPQYQENWVQPAFESATEALDGAIEAVDAALSAELEMYSQRINAAVAVLTKQKAVAANQVSDAQRVTAQMTADSLNALAQSERVKHARFDFGGEFGQGFQPCQVYAGRNIIANRDADLDEERRQRMLTEVVAAPGRYADADQGMAALVQDHQSYFCTADQVAAGMCKNVGSMPGASVKASTLFEPVMETDPLYKAKIAFVNNIVGLPDQPVPQAAANSPAAAAYANAKAQKDALMSPALASFKAVQLDYSGVTTPHSGQDVPLAARLDKEVARYLGNSPDYDAWTKVMAGQNTRGLLVEMLKIKALDLHLMEREYRQYERMEANLATLVAGETRKLSERTAAAADQAATQGAKAQIK